MIPERIITKPPSAELRANQTDQDSLPPYDELDAILQGLVEQDLSARELVAAGHDPAVVRRVSNLLDLAEYKRRQAPPGVKITRKAFGRDRRYPITNAFRKIGLSGQGREGQGGRSGRSAPDACRVQVSGADRVPRSRPAVALVASVSSRWRHHSSLPPSCRRRSGPGLGAARPIVVL